MSEIKVTYETLFDLLRREKSREELQKLDPSFYTDVLTYLQEKQAILQDTSTQAELFASSEKEKIRIQFQNIKKILRELYERREKKIIYMALTKARTHSSLIDTQALLESEKQLFQELTHLLTRYKDLTLTTLLGLILPESHAVLPDPSLPSTPFTPPLSDPSPGAAIEPTPLVAVDAAAAKAHLTLRFKSPIPKFLGTELEIYGPYEPDQTAELPAEIAQVLIQKGRAEEVK